MSPLHGDRDRQLEAEGRDEDGEERHADAAAAAGGCLGDVTDDSFECVQSSAELLTCGWMYTDIGFIVMLLWLLRALQ